MVCILCLVQLLATYLIEHRQLCLEASAILELGAGAGLSGLVAAKLSRDASSCILTDNNERVLDLLQSNIQLNFPNDCNYLNYIFASEQK